MIHLTFFGRNDMGALGDAQAYSTLTPTTTNTIVGTAPLGATGAYIVSTVPVLVGIGDTEDQFYLPANEPFKMDVISGQEVFVKSLA